MKQENGVYTAVELCDKIIPPIRAQAWEKPAGAATGNRGETVAPATALQAPSHVTPAEPAAPACASLSEQITWHIQHGVCDIVALAKACGRNYDPMSRAVEDLVKRCIIHKVDGGWQMVTPVPAATYEHEETTWLN